VAHPIESSERRFVPSKASVWHFGKALLLVFGVLLLTRAVLRSSSGPPTGQLAKPFQLPVAGTNTERSLADFHGKPLLIEAVAPWCGACRDSAGAMHDAALAERRGPMQFLGVVIDTNRSGAAALKKAWDIPYEVLADEGQFASDYEISLLPTFILIDGSGVVKHVHNGRAERDEIEAWLAKVGASARPKERTLHHF
jgi:thiol-disulfide isomerase/thioredoxin